MASPNPPTKIRLCSTAMTDEETENEEGGEHAESDDGPPMSPVSMCGRGHTCIFGCPNSTFHIQQSKSHETNVKGKYFDVGECKEILKQHYLDVLCKIPTYPGSTEFLNMKDIYTDLSILEDLPMPVKHTTEINDYTEMFTKRKNQTIPTRLLVLGEGGSGKSTLVGKIAYDWATMKGHRSGEACVKHPLDNIDLLIVINLRKVSENMTLEDAISNQELLPEDVGFGVKDMYKYITDNPDKTMIIFDSYDEFNVRDGYLQQSKQSNNLSKILTSKQLRGCTVVVTSRPVKARDITDQEFGRRYTKFKVAGFSEDHVKTYVRKFFQNTDKIRLGESLLKYFEENNLCPGLASIPLMTQLMCIFWTEKNGEDIPTRRSELFSEIIKLRLKQSDQAVKFRNFVIHLGQVAYNGLWHPRNQLVFSMDEISKYVSQEEIDAALKTCILKRETDNHSDKTVNKCEFVSFFHKSFQEYCAGQYLASKSTDLDLCDLKDPDVCSKVKMILMHACGLDQTVGKIIINTLLETFSAKFTKEDISAYYANNLDGSRAQDIQNFIEICLVCSYEYGKSDINQKLLALFPNGHMRFIGMDPYTIASVEYFLENLSAEDKQEMIRSITIMEFPRRGDKKYYLFKSRILQDAHADVHTVLKDMKEEELSELRRPQIPDDSVTDNIPWHDSNYPFDNYADQELWQQFKHQQPPYLVNYTPILKAIHGIGISAFQLLDVKLSESSAKALVNVIKSGSLEHVTSIAIRQAGLKARHVERITEYLGQHKLPKLEMLDVSFNDACLPNTLGSVVLSQEISHLDVSYMTQKPEETASFVHTLSQSETNNFEELRMRGNSTNASVGLSLLNLIPRLRNISVLEINDVNGMEPDHHRRMLDELGFLTKLQELRIEHVASDDNLERVLSGLSEFLPSFKILKLLRVRPHPHDGDSDRRNRKSPDPLDSFLRALDQTPELQRLDMNGVYFEERLLDEVIRIARDHKYQLLRILRSDKPDDYDIPRDEFLQLY